ncbi:MAG: hypothetical protein N3E36_07510, partial [Sulfolobales archaeon]|nr:hypothetical protein [Sulfolobales archaeon]
LVLRAKRFTLTYVYVRIMGLCRNGKPNNVAWIELASLTRLVSLREIWMLYKYFSYTAMLLRKVKDGEKTIDSHVSTIISKHVFKVWWKAYWIRIMYFNDHEWLDESYVPLVERIGVLK